MSNLRRSIFCGLIAAAASVAHSAEPVTNTLTVHRVVTHADGSEQLEAASPARPGDVLEYTAEFRNSGSAIAHALEATLPIPAGVALVTSSVRPAAVRVSVDGTTFAPIPLMHRVRRADGSIVEQPVPSTEYRYVRWAPADLAPNGSLSVSARVVLAGNADTPAVP